MPPNHSSTTTRIDLKTWTLRALLAGVTAGAVLLGTAYPGGWGGGRLLDAAPVPTSSDLYKFAVLGSAGVTASGAAGTVISGSVGSSPTATIIGFPPAIVTPGFGWSVHFTNDAEVIAAQAAAGALYTSLDLGACTTVHPAASEPLTGTFGPGIHCFSAIADLASTANMTLSGAGTYLFRVGTGLTANVGSTVTLGPGVDPCDVYWQVGSAAILNGDNFAGNVVTRAGVTLGVGADLTGRALVTTAPGSGPVILSGTNTVGGCSASGTIVVDKVTSPGGDPQSFAFTTTGAGYTGFSLTDAAAPNSQSLAPGTYSVAETALAGWTATSATCDGGNTPAAIVLAAGATVTCTFTNTKQGTIVVDKVTSPGGDPQSFTFTTTGAGYTGFSLTDAAAPNSQGLAPGTYSVTETAVAGWTATGATCDGGNTPGAIVLAAGATVTCTFTNTKQGTIVVDKVTSPAGDPQSFAFTTTGAGYTGFSLTGAAAPNTQSLVPGTYSVAETALAGWTATSAGCSGGNTPGAIVLAAGATVTCTFTNTKEGTIVVDKVTSPAGDPQSFTFTTTGAGYTGFSLTDAAAPNSQSLVPGAYSVAETALAGWTATSAGCSGGNTPGAIVLAAGATVTCVFVNTKDGALPPPGIVIVDKVTVPGGDPQSFAFATTGAGYTGFTLTDAAAPNSQSLVPATYSVAETVPAGWTLTGATCSDGSPVAAIVLGSGEIVTCTFTNTKEGTIVVDKVTSPAGDAQSFAFTTTGAGYTGFSLTGAAAPNSQSLAPGAYSVAETAVAGWTATGATCDGGNTPGAIVLAAGATVTCTFTNTKEGTIVVDKVTSPAGDAQSFAFTTTGAGYAGFSLTDAAAPNSQSLAPGAYAVAETALAGWTATSAGCSGGNTPAAVVLAAGATVTCVFVNTKDGALPPPGMIIVDKVTVPGGDPQSFAFTTTGAGYAGFSLTDATAPNTQSLAPGTYSVAETAVAGWAATGATCDGGNAPGAIVLAAGAAVTCTFTNTRLPAAGGGGGGRASPPIPTPTATASPTATAPPPTATATRPATASPTSTATRPATASPISTATRPATASPTSTATPPAATMTPAAAPPSGGAIGILPAPAPAQAAEVEAPDAQDAPGMTLETGTAAAPVALPNAGGPMLPLAVPAAGGLALAGIGLVLRRRAQSARVNRSP